MKSIKMIEMGDMKDQLYEVFDEVMKKHHECAYRGVTTGQLDIDLPFASDESMGVNLSITFTAITKRIDPGVPSGEGNVLQ